MKILIPIVAFGKNGGHRVLSMLANYMIKRRHEVSFICCFKDTDPYFPTQANIIDLSEKHNDKIKNKSLFYKLKFLKKGIEKYNDFDIIVANQCMTAYPVRFAKAKAKKVYYIQAYEPDFYRLNGFLLKNIPLWFFARISYKLDLHQIVNSPIYYNYPDIKARNFVPPGINLEIFYPKTEKKIKTDRFIIGCIGRTQKYKGTNLVLKSYDLIREKLDNICLDIAFGDPCLIDNKKNITVSLPKSDSELADYYRKIDILIAPNAIQLGAYHYPVMEAMACGIPVITSGHLPGNSTNAWIIRKKNIEDIVKQTVKVFSSSQKVQEKIERGKLEVKRLSWPKVVNDFEDLLNNIIEKE